jgi:hypothetical protein
MHLPNPAQAFQMADGRGRVLRENSRTPIRKARDIDPFTCLPTFTQKCTSTQRRIGLKQRRPPKWSVAKDVGNSRPIFCGEAEGVCVVEGHIMLRHVPISKGG